MFNKKIVLTFTSDWHVGSGLGAGASADSVLTRDANGLPCIPGRAIKGALREGAWRLALVGGRPDLGSMVDILFGSSELASFSNLPGRARVGMGKLAPDLAKWLLTLETGEREAFVSDLAVICQQTALDENKRVIPHSLRSVERGIPGVWFLSSLTIDAPEIPAPWLENYLACLLASVKSVGADRARGLGNCKLEFEGRRREKVALPEQCPEIQNTGKKEREC